MIRRLWLVLLAAIAALALAAPAQAANCSVATAQGSTGPANWQSYCWIDFSTYNDTAARSASGQNYSLTLSDGTLMTFNMKVSGVAIGAVTAPSWSGASVGNSAFTGIAGSPVLYSSATGTTTIAFSSIVLTPPAGATAATQYMFVAADGESTNDSESLAFKTNGANWVQLDQAGPISGATYPTTSGIGTNTFTETGVAGTVGAYIVGSNTPTAVTTTMVSGGLEGAMFAIRFATIKLNTTITGARANAADQFTYAISSTTSGAALVSGATSGAGLGPFTQLALNASSGVPLTLAQTMAAGSVSTLAHYREVLTCTNATGGSSTVMPSGVVSASYSFGTLQFGDIVTCNFVDTPYPHLTLQKALAASGRQFTGDQFTMQVSQGATVVATATTTGSGATITTGVTPQAQVTAGTAYTFGEIGAGSTNLAQYSSAMACTNLNASSTTVLPTSVGGNISPAVGDVVTCTITNTKRATNATLTAVKTSALISDPVHGATNPMAIPGAIVAYSFTVANTGPASVDANSVFLVDTLPSAIHVGTAANATFTQGSPTSALTFAPATDIKYSNAASAPASFAACTYTPVSAYDPAVKFVCLNPKGTMAGSTGTAPSFTITIQGQIG